MSSRQNLFIKGQTSELAWVTSSNILSPLYFFLKVLPPVYGGYCRPLVFLIPTISYSTVSTVYFLLGVLLVKYNSCTMIINTTECN